MYSSDSSFFGDGPSNFGLDCYEEFKRNGVKRIMEWGVDKIGIQYFLLLMV